eukprot:124589-Pyramimonas_sp.AAC.1
MCVMLFLEGCSLAVLLWRPCRSNMALVFLAWSRMPRAMANLTKMLESVLAVLMISGTVLCRMRA